jgi:uncharacterized protein
MTEQPVIDFHTHIFPDALAFKAMPKMEASAKVKAFFDGTLAGLRDSMRQSGVDISVIQPVATKPDQVDTINAWSVELDREPDLRAFGSLHPDTPPEVMDPQIRFLKQNGLRGIKLHPDYQRFHPHEDRLEFMYTRLSAEGLAVLFHAGIDLGLYPPIMCTPEHLAQVQKAFPALTIIAAHLGGFQMWDDVEKYLVGTRMFFDTAYLAGQIPRERWLEIARAHGLDKIIYASDGPWGDQRENLDFIQSSGLTPDEVRTIISGNAQRLLGEKKTEPHLL